MRTNIAVLSDKISLKTLSQTLNSNPNTSQRGQVQRLYPVMDSEGKMTGVVTRKDLQKLLQEHAITSDNYQLAELVHHNPIVAYPDEPLRTVVYRMAGTGFTRLPVVERSNPQKLIGMISLNDLLKARARNLEEERRRERVLRLHLLFPVRTRKEEEKLGKVEIRENEKPEDTPLDTTKV
jgi:CBS domain-containing protein